MVKSDGRRGPFRALSPGGGCQLKGSLAGIVELSTDNVDRFAAVAMQVAQFGNREKRSRTTTAELQGMSNHKKRADSSKQTRADLGVPDIGSQVA